MPKYHVYEGHESTGEQSITGYSHEQIKLFLVPWLLTTRFDPTNGQPIITPKLDDNDNPVSATITHTIADFEGSDEEEYARQKGFKRVKNGDNTQPVKRYVVVPHAEALMSWDARKSTAISTHKVFKELAPKNEGGFALKEFIVEAKK